MDGVPLHELHKLCRICLKSDILVSMYSHSFLIRPIEMLQKLQILKVTDDGLPSLLCQSCLYRLLDAYNLQQLAEASERRLRDYFGLSSNVSSILSNLAPDISITPTSSTTHATDLMKTDGECSSSSMYANICDMMFDRHDVTNDMVEVVGTDDVELLNDVEIDVSNLTRSEADDTTLGDVFASKTRLMYESQQLPSKRVGAEYKITKEPPQVSVFSIEDNEQQQIKKKSAVKPKNVSMKMLRKALKTPDECSECGKLFHYKGYLQIHKRVHTGERPFKCTNCPRQFITSTKLLLHQRNVHGGYLTTGSNNTDISSGVSTTCTSLSDRKRFQCELCSAFFVTSSNLKSHMFTHAETRNYVCQQCQMAFKSPRNLRRHEHTHKSIRDILCSLCEKSFTKHSSLSAHMLTVHRPIRKYECTECHRVFGKKSTLINHKRIHSGEKPFECPSCSWKFTQSSALRRHMKQHDKSKTSNKSLTLP